MCYIKFEVNEMYDFKKSKDGVLLEGFLNCENKAEILFIMKEPNSEEQKDFWFWKVVYDEKGLNGKPCRRKNGMKFYNVLGKLSKYIMNCLEESTESVLKKCAFINLYPYDGKASAHMGGYSLLMESLYSLKGKNIRKNKLEQIEKFEKEKNIDLNELAKSRLELINQLCSSGVKYILTVPEIYKLFSNDKISEDEFLPEYENGKFHFCQLENGTIIYEFWHPSYPKINYNNLDKALNI